MTPVRPANNKIFIAEDDEDDQEFIREAIKKVNPYQELHLANNGKELLEQLGKLKDGELPCLVVIDLNMPVMDGWQTLDALSRLTKFTDVPKVIFTTSDMEEDKNRAMEKGAAGFVTKPSNMTEVVNLMTRMLNYCR